MQTIIITGSAGLIGTILRKHWRDKYRIIGVDTRPHDDVHNEQVFAMGIEDEHLGEVFSTAGENAIVVHLAASTWDDAGWEAIERNNIQGMANVVRLAHAHKAKKVIFASTNHVSCGYGDVPADWHGEPFLPSVGLVTTAMPPQPDSLYGASKAFGEALLFYYSHHHNLPSISLRIGGVTANDDPRESHRQRAAWLSHRDLCQLMDCCLKADITYGVYFAISNNAKRFWDIETTKQELGYRPHDDAEDWYTKRKDTG